MLQLTRSYYLIKRLNKNLSIIWTYQKKPNSQNDNRLELVTFETDMYFCTPDPACFLFGANCSFRKVSGNICEVQNKFGKFKEIFTKTEV